MPRHALRAFLASLVAAHPDNAFHNLWHVVDVLHAVHLLCTQTTAAAGASPCLLASFPAEERLALYLAAVCHDVRHPGLSNAFVRASRHTLFLRHGAGSPLERHHSDCAVQLIADAGVLAGLSDAQRERVTELVGALILATDVERNAAHCDALRDAVSACGGSSDADIAKWAAAPDARRALLCSLLKVADVSNVCKPWRLAARWAGLLKVEHLLLAAREQEAGLPPTAFLSAPMADMCAGFITHIAGPMVRQLAAVLPWLNGAPVAYLEDNLARWTAAAAAADEAERPVPPERPVIGHTQLECLAARRVACA